MLMCQLADDRIDGGYPGAAAEFVVELADDVSHA
jgi:hypothetical protein